MWGIPETFTRRSDSPRRSEFCGKKFFFWWFFCLLHMFPSLSVVVWSQWVPVPSSPRRYQFVFLVSFPFALNSSCYFGFFFFVRSFALRLFPSNFTYFYFLLCVFISFVLRTRLLFHNYFFFFVHFISFHWTKTAFVRIIFIIKITELSIRWVHDFYFHFKRRNWIQVVKETLIHRTSVCMSVRFVAFIANEWY